MIARLIATSTMVIVLCAALLSVVSSALAAPLRFEEERIEAEVQKPEVTVFVSRENLSKAFDLDLERSFLDKIVESVEDYPF